MRRRLSAEDGSALVVSIIVLALVLSISGAVFNEAFLLNKDVRNATGQQRAFQAAQAGIDQALARINVLHPTDFPPQCVTRVLASPDASGWCDTTPAESLGTGQTFTYRVTSSPPPGGTCVGDAPPPGSADRCIVAIGMADGVQARVRTRVAITTSPMPFASNTSVVGYREVKIKKGAKVKGRVQTNRKLRVEATGSIDTSGGNIPQLGPKAKVRGYTGPVERRTSPFVPALPDFWMIDPATGARRDTAVWNDNPTLIQALPAGKFTYSGPVTRELTIADGVTVTLPAGIYNLCKLSLGKDAKINIAGIKTPFPPAPNDAVRIFIDSKDRAGSQCRDRGTLDSKSGASFANANADPRTLQIFAWSKRSKLKVPNKVAFKAIIYAPASKVSFNSTGTLTGGIAADKVDIHNNMQAIFSNALIDWTVSKLNASQVVGWNQCPSTNASTDPQAGC
ncbi:MAG TPA: hypothetical protein VGJ32_05785 [Solirubrobacteraceae bacterium]